MNDEVAKAVQDSAHCRTAKEPPELVIRARKGWITVNWGELFQYRELFFFLVWRDVIVRYKQTVLGIIWAILPPVFSLIIFTMIFGRFVPIPSDGLPYPVFVYAGILPWMFFANAVTQAGMSLVNQQHLITKAYFPRLFIPASMIVGGLVDLIVSFLVYALILAIYGVVPGWEIVFVLPLIVLTVLVALGLGLLLAALTITYRDFRFVVPFMVQALMFLSPVIYPASLYPQRFEFLFALNPMVGIIQGYRSAILGTPWNSPNLTISCVVAIALFLVGLFYFQRTERRFADIA